MDAGGINTGIVIALIVLAVFIIIVIILLVRGGAHSNSGSHVAPKTLRGNVIAEGLQRIEEPFRA